MTAKSFSLLLFVCFLGDWGWVGGQGGAKYKFSLEAHKTLVPSACKEYYPIVHKILPESAW